MILYTMHKFDSDKLAEVMSDASEIGSVTLNVYYDGEVYHALEGVHRTESAKRLGLPLVLVTKEWDDVVAHDIPDLEEGASVGEIVDYGYSRFTGSVYSEDDFASVEVN